MIQNSVYNIHSANKNYMKSSNGKKKMTLLKSQTMSLKQLRKPNG